MSLSICGVYGCSLQRNSVIFFPGGSSWESLNFCWLDFGGEIGYRKNNQIEIYKMGVHWWEKNVTMKEHPSSVLLPTMASGIAPEESAWPSAADDWHYTTMWKLLPNNQGLVETVMHIKYILVYIHSMFLYSILKC